MNITLIHIVDKVLDHVSPVPILPSQTRITTNYARTNISFKHPQPTNWSDYLKEYTLKVKCQHCGVTDTLKMQCVPLAFLSSESVVVLARKARSNKIARTIFKSLLVGDDLLVIVFNSIMISFFLTIFYDLFNHIRNGSIGDFFFSMFIFFMIMIGAVLLIRMLFNAVKIGTHSARVVVRDNEYFKYLSSLSGCEIDIATRVIVLETLSSNHSMATSVSDSIAKGAAYQKITFPYNTSFLKK